MGLFLSMSGVLGAKKPQVVELLDKYATAKNGQFSPIQTPDDTSDSLVISESEGNTTVIYPSMFIELDEVSAYLSQSLHVPVFSLHIHDGDLWMYVLFINGEDVDQFNPIPDYWSDNITEDERQRWAGNSRVISRCCPSIREESIKNYLVKWNILDEVSGKAYHDDEFCFNDCWQLVDFMKKIHLPYPIDSNGVVSGECFKFKIKKPWKK
jgi:hypothetical protein